MKISRIITKRLVSNDDEARDWKWEYDERPYDELAKNFAYEHNSWYKGVALIEETFDSDTFKITSRTIREMKLKYDYVRSKYFRDVVGVEEFIYE